MKHALLILSLLALAGCQSAPTPRTTVIAPLGTEGEPASSIRWVKRDNVFYLQLEPATPSN